uniref:Reverse transcriptase n=1 Tax=Bursaphelenchus xylophilus TaxID=6326 RepID=A0A1I7SI16_BURXY
MENEGPLNRLARVLDGNEVGKPMKLWSIFLIYMRLLIAQTYAKFKKRMANVRAVAVKIRSKIVLDMRRVWKLLRDQ